MHVWIVSATVRYIPLFGEDRFLCEIVITMQLVDVFCDDHTIEVRPRTATNTVACIDATRARGAQVGMLGLVTSTN